MAIDFSWVEDDEELECYRCEKWWTGNELIEEFVSPSISSFNLSESRTGYEYFCPYCGALVTTKYWNMYQ